MAGSRLFARRRMIAIPRPVGDLNADVAEGFGRIDTNIADGRRASTLWRQLGQHHQLDRLGFEGWHSRFPRRRRLGPELNDWTRGLIALRQRWTHLRRAEFADYTPSPRAAPGDPAKDGKLSYSW